MSRVASRVVLAVVLAFVLAMGVSWLAWVSLAGNPSPSHHKSAQAARILATNPNVTSMDAATCIALETAYLAAYPKRTDLHVNGNDCNYARTIGVGTPPGGGAATNITTMSTCTGYWESVNLNVWGFIQVGYIQLAIGACYNGTTTVTRQWGPTCQIVFWPPNMKGWVDYQGYYGSGTSQMTDYCQTQAQIWIAPFGWCCDKYFYYQFTVNYWGDEWWS